MHEEFKLFNPLTKVRAFDFKGYIPKNKYCRLVGGCSSENFENTPIKAWYQNLILWTCPNSFPPLRGTNSTTTNYITGTANFNSIKDNFGTFSSRGPFESIVINLYRNIAHQLWQQSF